MRAFLCGVLVGLVFAVWCETRRPAVVREPMAEPVPLVEEEQLDSEALDSWGVDDVQVF